MTDEAHGDVRLCVVADDEPAIRELISGALSREGFDVLQAGNGNEVVALLRSRQVDLLISDIHMPGLSGLEAVDVAREVSPETSSIVITGVATLETARSAAQCGAYDYLPKPFSERDLVEAVTRALARREQDWDRSRQRELADLSHLSEGVQATEDPWEMLRLTATAALYQTKSDVGCFAARRDGRLWPFCVGASTSTRVCEPLGAEDLLAEATEKRSPLLLTRAPAHPLAGVVTEVREGGSSVLDPVAEALVFPVVAGNQAIGALAMGRQDRDRPYTKGDYQLLTVLAAQCGLLMKNAELVEDLQRAYVGTVHSMARMVEARDQYTHGHSQRVAELCRRVAQVLEVSPADAETLETAAGLHDIGKLAIPDSVLNKPGKLTDEEWASVRRHPVVGEQVLAPAAFLADACPLVRHHHERYDGKGYPDQLRVDDLAPLAHIIIAADAWDAMTSDRPYRPALGAGEALREIERGRGSQFHPDVAEALIGLMAPGV